MHTVAVLAFEDAIAFDIATAVEIFGGVVLGDGGPAYRVLVSGPTSEVSAGPLGIVVPHRLSVLEEADTVIVPGLRQLGDRAPAAVVEAITVAHQRGARIASICVGALTLADAGLLTGRRATTHWQAADVLQQRGPGIDVDPNVLFVDEGNILTSAGGAAGIDLCLHMVARDFGAGAANDAARRSVVARSREGGQAQYIPHRPDNPAYETLDPLLVELGTRVALPWTIATIAREARLSTRTLSRRFLAETGATPVQWINGERVRQARILLEGSDLPVEVVGQRVGFPSAVTFRTHFRRATGTTPGHYRTVFSALPAGGKPTRAVRPPPSLRRSESVAP